MTTVDRPTDLPALSAAASRTHSSTIRDLLDHARRPDMISLAGGLPDAERFPVEEMAEVARRVTSATTLQYSPTAGDCAARAAMAGLFDDATDPDDVVITTGSQQAVDLIGRSLLDPDDPVVVGDPEYLGALQAFQAHGAAITPIPIDRDGLRVDVLEARLRDGLRPKLCYIVPHFHNPTGAVLSTGRRRHLNGLSSTYGFVVVEDDPYRELTFDDLEPPPPIGDPELTVRLRSTSKILAPGLRIGALSGPRWLLQPVVRAKQAADLHTGSLAQAVVAAALSEPWFDGHVRALRRHYRAKRDALAEALVDVFGPALLFRKPRGGMFLWARTEPAVDTEAWLARALDAGVCFVPGRAFATEQHLSAHLRLSFATASPAELTEAAARLAASFPMPIR